MDGTIYMMDDDGIRRHDTTAGVFFTVLFDAS
jgi:hypothetical protein